MAAPASKPAFVLIPGSFSPPTVWEKVVPLLVAAGFEAYPTPLQSAGEREQGPATMQEDADFIHDAVEQLADQGKDVVLAMNSYGGIPGSQAVLGLSKNERQERGKPGGLIALVYVSSFLPTVGSTSNTLMRGAGSDDFDVPGGGTDPYMDLNRDRDWKNIFSDLGEEEARMYTSRLLKQSTVSFTGALTYPGYKHISSTFLLTEGDKIVPPELQRSMIAAAEADGAQIKTVVITSDHVPMLSHPEKTAEVLMNAATAA